MTPAATRSSGVDFLRAIKQRTTVEKGFSTFDFTLAIPFRSRFDSDLGIEFLPDRPSAVTFSTACLVWSVTG
jgi:hypothetical protein